jgi:integrase
MGKDDKGKRKRRTVYAPTKAEVQEKLRRLQNDAAGGLLSDAPRLTVGEYLKRWLEDAVRPARTPNTYASYEGAVRNHIARHLGGVRLASLSPVAVQGLYSAMERGGASPRTRELAHAVLHRALAQAVKWGLAARNACDAVERPKVPRKEMKVYTPEQTRRLLEAARGHRLGALFVLAAATGARQGELFGLRWPDVDLEGGTVHVQRTLEERGGRLRLKEPKSAKSRRRVELPRFAAEALAGHRARMAAEGFATDEHPVFPDTRGGWLRKSNFIRKVYKPLLRRAGLPELKFHALRHGLATLMLTAGTHPKVVQEWLGHAQASMTLDVYSHVLPSLHREAADRIDEALRGAGG